MAEGVLTEAVGLTNVALLIWVVTGADCAVITFVRRPDWPGAGAALAVVGNPLTVDGDWRDG